MISLTFFRKEAHVASARFARSAPGARPFVAAFAMLLFIAPPAHAQQLTLHDAIDRALRFAPSLEASIAASDLSEATIREMRAPMFPSVTASGEYAQWPGYDIVVTNRGLTRAQLELDYTAVDFGRRMSRVRSARYAAEAARLGLSATRAQIIFDTSVAYFDLMRAKNAVVETQANVERLSRYVDTIDRLTRSGRAIENDSLKARTVRDTAELALSDARNDQMNAATVLGSMMGDFTRYDFDIAEPRELPKMSDGPLLHSPPML